MSTDLVHLVIWYRLAERGLLTFSVIAASAWLAWAYVGKFTKVALSAESLSEAKVSITLGTPIVVILLFIGYTYVDLSNGIEMGPAVPNGRLANAREVQAQGKTDCQLDTPIPLFRGLNEVDEGAHSTQEPSGSACMDETEANRKTTAFDNWMQKKLRITFASLLGKDKLPLGAEGSAEILNAAIAIGCLDADAKTSAGFFDLNKDNQNFEQIRARLQTSLKVSKFTSSICTSLQMEN